VLAVFGRESEAVHDETCAWYPLDVLQLCSHSSQSVQTCLRHEQTAHLMHPQTHRRLLHRHPPERAASVEDGIKTVQWMLERTLPSVTMHTGPEDADNRAKTTKRRDA
jgi:hypothetical protein